MTSDSVVIIGDFRAIHAGIPLAGGVWRLAVPAWPPTLPEPFQSSAGDIRIEAVVPPGLHAAISTFPEEFSPLNEDATVLLPSISAWIAIEAPRAGTRAVGMRCVEHMLTACRSERADLPTVARMRGVLWP